MWWRTVIGGVRGGGSFLKTDPFVVTDLIVGVMMAVYTMSGDDRWVSRLYIYDKIG